MKRQNQKNIDVGANDAWVEDDRCRKVETRALIHSNGLAHIATPSSKIDLILIFDTRQ